MNVAYLLTHHILIWVLHRMELLLVLAVMVWLSISCRNKSFAETCSDSNSCLEMQADGVMRLKTTRSYFYQVQAHIKLCNAMFCDLVVWSENELFVQRIMLDDSFMQSAFDKATNFFKVGILPELLGNWYSRAPTYALAAPDPGNDHDDSSRLPADSDKSWCFCRQPESGEMIACDPYAP